MSIILTLMSIYMNKLVIIGNGFDLAHGLKTSYKDFVLWYLNEKFKNKSNHKEDDLISISTEYVFDEFKSLKDFFNKIGHHFRIDYKDEFFSKILNLLKRTDFNWVDIEKEYFEQVLNMINPFLKSGTEREINNLNISNLIKLNSSLDIIKKELATYLETIYSNVINNSIQITLKKIIDKDNTPNQEIMYLNFNYTSTIELYNSLLSRSNFSVNYIHGRLKDEKNPIIFGYGDESNDYFEKIEKMNNNELTRHLKSFAYLQTANYRRLFEFLDKGNFEVYVMGHSLGLSDRLLFNHIFEHEKFNKVQLYFYEYQNEKGEIVNDFFQKTQELSRHFKLNSKHKMRTKVVPFNESKSLTIYKP